MLAGLAVGIAAGVGMWLVRANLNGGGLGQAGYLIAANAFLIACLIVLVFGYSDLRRVLGKRSALAGDQTIRLLHHLNHISKNRTALSSFALQNENNPHQRDPRSIRTAAFLRSLIDETRAMFEDYVQRSCAVSIKLLVLGSDGRPFVQTYLRDSDSILYRNSVYSHEEMFPFDAHSPFVDIVTGKTVGDFFLDNDLRSSHRLGEYRNANPKWQHLYNAALVVPIKQPDSASNENILGFLCIDTMNGKFDESACVSMAQIVSNCIFLAFLELSILGVDSVGGQTGSIAGEGRANAV